MDKITFESVMEEIKKSLGEARLMSIEEAMSDSMQRELDDGPGGMDKKEPPKPVPPKPVGNPDSKVNRMQRDINNGPGDMGPTTPAPAAAAPKDIPPQTSAPKPVSPPTPQVPASLKAQGKGPDAIPASLKAQGKTPEVSPPATADGGGSAATKPAAKPSAPKLDTAAIYAKHGVGSSDESAGAFHRAEAEIAAARKAGPSAPTPSAPASRPQPNVPSVSPPRTMGSSYSRMSPMPRRGLREQAIEKFKGGGADIQDLAGPNKVVGTKPREQHHGLSEEEIEEAKSTATGLGGTHASGVRKSAPNINKAGAGLRQRASAERSGNQRRNPDMYAEEATKKVLKKLKEKKGEQPLGKTSTGQPGDTIDTQPTKPELVGYH